jgi:glycosyltransferase involved in cell wall biosynthesis
MAPKVSVVIPTYNNALLLPETLDGVMRQSFRNFELIVVDDGSTDATAQVVKSYEPGIIYCAQANLGPAAARNKGVRLAKGDYVAFCDHDDVWNERHLEMLLGCFSSHPASALAFDNAEYFGEGESEPRLHLKHERIHLFLQGRVTPEALLWHYPIATMSVVMLKRALFAKLGGLNERIVALDDLHFYLRLAVRAEVRYVDYVGCQKRVTKNNLSQQVNIKEINVQYLEDLWRHYPEVVNAIGPLSFRLRLARKYFKLARQYKQNCAPELAKEMFWNAYKTNCLNLRYLWCAARCDSPFSIK